MAKTALTIEDITEENLELNVLINNKLPIYVLNRSEPRGDIAIQYFKPDRSADLLIIPKTWIPICITDQASHKTLENCDDLRRNLRNGMVKLITPKEGLKIMSGSDAEEEYQRITVSKFAAFGKQVKDTKASDAFLSQLENTSNVGVKIRAPVWEFMTTPYSLQAG